MIALVSLLAATVLSTEQTSWKFDFGSEVSCSERFFDVDVPEGNYNVRVTMGDRDAAASTTVKAEGRRLMLENIATAAGKFDTRTFTVNVRYSEIAGGGQVRLKPREIGSRRWDHKLTLEFTGGHPCVSKLEINKVDDAITVFLAGDSTVVDQDKEPYAAWGQMLPRFFREGVAIANHAESGESARSFVGERRMEKLLTQMKAGDYLFIQFAHNDQKEKGTEAFGNYRERLKQFIDEARKRGATPVLVTAMNRRRFDVEGKIENTLGDFPEATRQTAADEHVALIDLNAMSKTLWESMGPEGTLKAFVHYPAGTFPDQTEELKDDTHFNSYGAYELAKCIVEGIKANKLPISKFLR